MLHKCSKTCTCLCIRSTMYVTQKTFPAKALSNCHSNKSMRIFHVAMAILSVPSLQFPISPQKPAQSSLWYLVATVWWQTCGTVGPETPQPLPWIGGPVSYLIGPRTTSNDTVNFLGRTIMEEWGGGIALYERPGQVLPIFGPVGGLGRMTPGGIDCALRRSGVNLLVSQLSCVRWGNNLLTVVGLMLCWGLQLSSPPG